jgi:hypothetical protein
VGSNSSSEEFEDNYALLYFVKENKKNSHEIKNIIKEEKVNHEYIEEMSQAIIMTDEDKNNEIGYSINEDFIDMNKESVEVVDKFELKELKELEEVSEALKVMGIEKLEENQTQEEQVYEGLIEKDELIELNQAEAIEEKSEVNEIPEKDIEIMQAVAVDIDLEISEKSEKNDIVQDAKIEYIILDKQIKNRHKTFIYVETQAIGGKELLYSFKIINKGEVDSIDYSYLNNFSIELTNEDLYIIESYVKDESSKNKYDSKAITFIHVAEDKIDYSLINIKDDLLINEDITIDFYNTKLEETKFKYIINFEDIMIDETKLSENLRLIITPVLRGQYIVDVVEEGEGIHKTYFHNLALKIEEYKSVTIKDIHIDKTKYLLDIPITISVEVINGKEVMYEFYYKEKDKWNMVQKYSKKNYYTYFPIKEGKISFFVIVKSSESKEKYDNYKKINIIVNK